MSETQRIDVLHEYTENKSVLLDLGNPMPFGED
jgi:hypothetical protein